MSIAGKLHWTLATKPKSPKATEHSGAKRGKGAWDKKKVAKKSSRKARRAADKQAVTVGDEADLPFPGAAPLFKAKASDMNWSTEAEPRPCYEGEDPVEDHCNENIAPPAPGGGDDMSEEGPGGYGWDDDDGGDLGEEDYEGMDPGTDPMERGEDDDSDDDGDWSPERWEQEIEKDKPEPDPMEAPEPEVAPEPEPAPPEQGAGKPSRATKIPRHPSLAPDDPHQFWFNQDEYVQMALHQYVKPRLQDPDPKIAGIAKELLLNGPAVGNYSKKDLMDRMRDPKWWAAKSRQKDIRLVEKEEGMPPGSLGPVGDEEYQRMQDKFGWGDDERHTTTV